MIILKLLILDVQNNFHKEIQCIFQIILITQLKDLFFEWFNFNF